MKPFVMILICLAVFMAITFPQNNASAAEPMERHLPRYYRQLLTFFGLKQAGESPEPEAGNGVETFEYQIQRGDTLFSIAKKYGTDVDTLVRLNGIVNPNLITPGEVIEVINVTGLVHTVQWGETWEQIARDYQVETGDIIGLDGARKGNLSSGQRIVIAGSRGTANPGRAVLPSFMWPVDGRITSRFGWRSSGFHFGLDVAAPTGTPVRASAAGIITYASYRGNYGLLVEIDHGNACYTRYAHNSRVLVSVGQKVNRGDSVSLVGATGDATGPHVHFEIIVNGIKVDPLNHLPQR